MLEIYINNAWPDAFGFAPDRKVTDDRMRVPVPHFPVRFIFADWVNKRQH